MLFEITSKWTSKNIKKGKFEANTWISFLFQKMSLPLLHGQSSCIEIRKALNNENFITQIFKQSAQAADVVQCAVGAGSSSCTQSKSMSSSCTRPTSWSSIGPRITSRNTLQHSLVWKSFHFYFQSCQYIYFIFSTQSCLGNLESNWIISCQIMSNLSDW